MGSINLLIDRLYFDIESVKRNESPLPSGNAFLGENTAKAASKAFADLNSAIENQEYLTLESTLWLREFIDLTIATKFRSDFPINMLSKFPDEVQLRIIAQFLEEHQLLIYSCKSYTDEFKTQLHHHLISWTPTWREKLHLFTRVTHPARDRLGNVTLPYALFLLIHSLMQKSDLAKQSITEEQERSTALIAQSLLFRPDSIAIPKSARCFKITELTPLSNICQAIERPLRLSWIDYLVETYRNNQPSMNKPEDLKDNIESAAECFLNDWARPGMKVKVGEKQIESFNSSLKLFAFVAEIYLTWLAQDPQRIEVEFKRTPPLSAMQAFAPLFYGEEPWLKILEHLFDPHSLAAYEQSRKLPPELPRTALAMLDKIILEMTLLLNQGTITHFIERVASFINSESGGIVLALSADTTEITFSPNFNQATVTIYFQAYAPTYELKRYGITDHGVDTRQLITIKTIANIESLDDPKGVVTCHPFADISFNWRIPYFVIDHISKVAKISIPHFDLRSISPHFSRWNEKLRRSVFLNGLLNSSTEEEIRQAYLALTLCQIALPILGKTPIGLCSDLFKKVKEKYPRLEVHLSATYLNLLNATNKIEPS